jgi:protein-serine/threonine kinase
MSSLDGTFHQLQDIPAEYQPAANQRFASPMHTPGPGYMTGAVLNTESDPSIDHHSRPQQYAPAEPFDPRRTGGTVRSNRTVLQKNKRFVDAWDTDESSRKHDHSGTSGPARKVMDFFRRRGKARAGEDR